MFQVLILVAVIFLIYVISRISRNPTAAIPSNSSDMVKCTICGLNFPDSESVKKGENTFCSTNCSAKNGT